MTVDTNTMVLITEANQNFSKVARLVDELGSVVILKNNAPRYLVIDFSKADESAVAKDEDVIEISKRLLAQNKEACSRLTDGVEAALDEADRNASENEKDIHIREIIE